ncbi:MAG: ribonuclease III [Candidatus Pacebacteria bacterium]|nr:ribonuclease III [Candidatus Paceibacterota bacterium]
MDNFKSFEKIIDYKFKNQDFLKEALTHRSYLNENSEWKYSQNERMEFLGDAVLELVTTEELFLLFPQYPEGKLTPIRSALVNFQMMAKIARDFKLDDFILLSKGEAKDSGRAREVILANGAEAVIGAIYLDGGLKPVKLFIKKFVMNNLEEILAKGLQYDAKSKLQEMIQEKNKVTPVYKVLGEEGPDHARVFTSGVFFGEQLIATGTGQSKQDAEVDAAKKALQSL